MTALEWTLTITLVVLYVALWLTVAVVTLRKGYVALFLFGIIVPILWLIGAVMPAKTGSSYAMTQV